MGSVQKTRVTRSHRAVRFQVDDVERATERLPEWRTHDAIAKRLGPGAPLEACNDYHSRIVASHETHPLIETCVKAWLEHRPLVLTPDTIWLALAQTFATHVNQNAEALRSKLVMHEGKKRLLVEGEKLGFVPRSPENPWPLAFSAFGEQIRKNSQGGYDLVVARFSTTGPAELAAQEVTLLDAFQAYFEYELSVGCGLTEVTLVGEVADWELLRAKTRRFAEYGLGEWVKAVEPILGQFVGTSEGDADKGFWRDIVRYHETRGFYNNTKTIDGWLAKLLPFGKSPEEGLKHAEATRHYGDFASGLSSAPMIEKSDEGQRELQLLAGYVGIKQAAHGLALCPKIGWAVREKAPERPEPETAGARELEIDFKDRD